ncbi:MAG: aldo/keto reductase, partial [Candidatus Mariimomonas ferrooxydans]
IDFYHFHSLNEHFYEEKLIKFDLIDEAQKAMDEGLIKHISFSFHDDPENLKRFVNLGVFDSVLCQYNFLDQTNEEAIEYAVSRGVGVAVMGPVVGGRLLGMEMDGIKNIKDRNLINMALRFVFSNKNVSTALSGMGTEKMLDENIETAEGPEELSGEEEKLIKEIQEKREIKEMIPCNDCGYCIDCPSGIPISRIFKIYNYNLLTKIDGNAKWQYNLIGNYDDKANADECSECGQCEEKCPQNIEIIEMLKEAHDKFSE